ncbi:antibiotic ABC transporter [Paracoccus pacificus]|uniref:Antibiotic ABC transporter n=1 Tax=Paracoccus pacificus TaxID=1463598 RepID=A0ABW4RB83_9RHOB
MARNLTPDFTALSPADSVRLWTELFRLGVESQMVIAMRVAGMMGLWPTSPGEESRMFIEKQDAAWAAFRAMSRAVGRGATPERMMAAALRPYSRRAHANAKRLSRAPLR